MEYLIFNRKFHAGNDTIITAGNRGLRYGEGVFETMKSIRGEIRFCDDHFARLWNGLQVLQFNIPKQFSPDQLQEEILGLLKKNNHLGTARVRLTVFKGEGGLYDAINHTPNYIIQSWALPDEKTNWNSNGLILGIYTAVNKNCDILSNLKHNNFLPYCMAATYAKNQKWNDAVLLNNHGRLCDTTIANIFLLKDGVVYTPALSEGCIAGVMRKNLIGQLKARKFEIRETEITCDDLLAADEVFLTNSMYDLRWVQMINDKKYGNRITKEIHTTIF